MKALRTTFAAVVLFIGAMTVNAQSMSIAAMRSNARFLTDRMAYTLGISDPYLIDEIYRINYDYIWGVNEYLDDVALGYYYDDYMAVVTARDVALRNLLGVRLWNRVINYTYFYRPIVFANRAWRFSIYDYDRYGVNRYYYHAPRPLVTYTGGHFFRGMAPNGAYRGAVPRRGEMNNMTPRVNGNINNNMNTNVNVNVNRNVNVNNVTSTPEMRNNGVNANTGGIRSGSNMNSSSRFNSGTRTTTTTSSSVSNVRMPTRGGSNIGTRTSAGASMGTRSSAGASMGTRGGGAAVGGRTGGGRR